MKIERAKRWWGPLSVCAAVWLSPWPVDSSHADSTAPRQPAFELVGVVKRDGDRSLALLQEPELTQGAPVLVRQGQSLGDYRLVAVEDDRVVLESPAGRLTVHIGGTKGPVTATPAPKPQRQRAPAPTTTADEADPELKGTPGGQVLDALKNAFGLGANPQ